MQGFDFNEHIDSMVGVLRRFNKQNNPPINDHLISGQKRNSTRDDDENEEL